jgi:phospholipid/cholesterol/gamma-HCH transport system substrate-binding protein
VLIIGALVGIAFLVGIRHLLEHTYTMRGEFTDAAGIQGGDAVRVAGVQAGRVTKIRADRNRGLVVVEWKVNSGVHLGPQTHAEIGLETLLGRKFVRLTGPVVKPYLEHASLAARTIPHDRTTTPFDIFQVLNVGTREVEATDTAKLNQFISDLADITADKQQQIHDLLDGLSRVSTAVETRDAQLRDLLDRLSTVSATFSQKDQTLVSLLDQSQGVLDLVSQRRNDIASGLENANLLFGNLNSIIGDQKASIDSILTTLHPTVDLLAKHEGDIDRALTWLGPGALGLGKAASHGPWQDIYVRSVGPDLIGVLSQLLGGTNP